LPAVSAMASKTVSATMCSKSTTASVWSQP
jgi:hypothetical protein